MDEDTSAIINVLANDKKGLAGGTITHINGTPISVNGSVSIANGHITLNADNTLTFTPDPNFFSSQPLSFTYTGVSANGKNVDSSTVIVEVASVNDAPTGTASALLGLGTEDTLYTISKTDLLAGFSDVDGGTLSVANLSGANGTFTENPDGSWTFAPNADFSGTVSFTYDVLDGQGGTKAASQSFLLRDNIDKPVGPTVEVLTTGSDNINNSANVEMVVEAAADTLNLDDTITGGTGRDTLLIAGTGALELGSFNLKASQQAVGLTMTGFENVDASGYAGPTNLVLTAGEGTRILLGGAGNDRVSFVDTTGGLIGGGAGIDTLAFSQGGTVRLGASDQVVASDSTVSGFENVNASAATQAVKLIGSGVNNLLRGGSAADMLRSGAGNDRLQGGAGGDTMLGGSGDDIYLVGAGDKVSEATSLNGTVDAGGIDTVRSAGSWTLGRFVEKLVLTGSADVDGTGNGAANRIAGNSGANDLVGRAGADNLMGRSGQDGLLGGAGSDRLFGGRGADQLSGGKGNDLLHGGSGVDRLAGGLGNDTFQFSVVSATADTIVDFGNEAGNNDRFHVSASGFGGGLVAGGALDADFFQIGATKRAQDANDRFIFRTTDDSLWFDVDGNGASAAVKIADLQDGAVVTSADILLV